MNIKVYGQQVIPSARRLMKSLRDLGYDFSQAVADIVDNSIEAGATEITIDVEFDGDHSRVRIADNGKGMTLSQLQEAMRYGSEREYSLDGLGKFGLGLKTASLSQCQKLSIASRADAKKSVVNACCWDLSYVEKTNRWEIINPDEKSLEKILGGHLVGAAIGTVVFWEHLDRMLGMKHPYGEAAKKRLASMSRDLEKHLAMVFHRFLGGEVSGCKLRIIQNGNDIEAWDPFARKEPNTKTLEPIKIRVEEEGVSDDIWLKPFILPPEKEFSSVGAHKKASGPANWNLQQGFYIYRADRLIQSGGWCKLRTVDEHLKLSRMALDFSPKLDDAFNVNVAKMRVQFPLHIRDQIGEIMKPINKEAQEKYRKSTSKHNTGPTPPSSSQNSHETTSPSQENVSRTSPVHDPKSRDNLGNPTQTKYWTLDELQSLLEGNAKPDEKPILARVFARIRKKLTR